MLDSKDNPDKELEEEFFGFDKNGTGGAKIALDENAVRVSVSSN